MRKLDRHSFVTVLALIAAGLGLHAHVAFAQECASDPDCAAGSTCRLAKQLQCSGGGCAGEPGGMGGAVAAGGAGGMAGSCDVQPSVCEAVTVGECSVPSCASDDECEPSTACREQVLMRCELVDPCPGLASCEVDPATVVTNCGEERALRCVPRASLPCDADADCGDGFECVVSGQQCSCDGGTGTGGAAGGPGEMGMGECTCTDFSTCQPLGGTGGSGGSMAGGGGANSGGASGSPGSAGDGGSADGGTSEGGGTSGAGGSTGGGGHPHHWPRFHACTVVHVGASDGALAPLALVLAALLWRRRAWRRPRRRALAVAREP